MGRSEGEKTRHISLFFFFLPMIPYLFCIPIPSLFCILSFIQTPSIIATDLKRQLARDNSRTCIETQSTLFFILGFTIMVSINLLLVFYKHPRGMCMSVLERWFKFAQYHQLHHMPLCNIFILLKQFTCRRILKNRPPPEEPEIDLYKLPLMKSTSVQRQSIHSINGAIGKISRQVLLNLYTHFLVLVRRILLYTSWIIFPQYGTDLFGGPNLCMLLISCLAIYNQQMYIVANNHR